MTEPAHYPHGPSSAHRWLNCPGSINAEAPYPDETTDPADEGTAAHWLLEQCLLAGVDAETYIYSGEDNGIIWAGDNAMVPAGEETGCIKNWPITGEMVESVQLAITEVHAHAKKKGTKLWVEDRVRLDDTLGLPAPVGGTCDIRLYLPRSKVLIVLDFKYGKGHVVELEEKDGTINEQAGLYALGALYDFEKNHPDKEVKWVELGIIQPRAYHKKGPVRRKKYTPMQLTKLEFKLIEVVPITLQEDAPRIPGEKQCHFCKAKRDCVEYAEFRGEEVRSEFDVEPASDFAAEVEREELLGQYEDHGPRSIEERSGQVIESGRDARYPDLQLPTLPPASSLTVEQLGQLQKAVPWLEQWCKDVKEETKTRLLHDCKVPGKKLAQGPGSRPWTDPAKVSIVIQELLETHPNLRASQFFKAPELRSVAQVENQLGKGKFKELLGQHVSYIAGGPIVVDEDSDKPDYVKPGSDFEAESAPEDIESHPLL